MSEPRYGIWIPVYGNWGAMNDPQEPVDTFMLQFQSFAPEIRRFAEEIMPRVRSIARSPIAYR